MKLIVILQMVKTSSRFFLNVRLSPTGITAVLASLVADNVDYNKPPACLWLTARLKLESSSIKGKSFSSYGKLWIQLVRAWESQLNAHRKVVVRSVSEPPTQYSQSWHNVEAFVWPSCVGDSKNQRCPPPKHFITKQECNVSFFPPSPTCHATPHFKVPSPSLLCPPPVA